ncbi:hypothetical protein IC235_20665 [Hymenobacter sp. BT664]|uniref:Uncharacterized protein n=1 Tax=Hymenobacter montanus TaxID=2771359 RepID=A0A927GL72_9BACT|nr:hypothetical protein [Hymenobacter montanus]MBD2770307.1 hypothetical protein [Hymenobacter montanus]
MKTNSLAYFRPVLTATVLLAMLPAVMLPAYQGTRRLPVPAPVTVAKQPAPLAPPIQSDTLTATAEIPPAASAPVLESCPPHPLVFSRGSRAAQRPLLVRRYVGTVGGQAATALLQWQNPDSITGFFYLHRGGPTYELSSSSSRARRAVVLQVSPEYPNDSAPNSQWHLPARPGAMLAGSWRTAAGSQHVALRESYVGAVPLAIRTLYLRGGKSLVDKSDDPNCTNQPSLSYDFWRLPAGPATVPPALRAVLNPTPAACRRTLRARLEGDGRATYSLAMRLNDFGLLSYQTYYMASPYGGRPQYEVRGSLFDLATGRALTMRSQLRPQYDLPLRRLIAWHLLHDAKFDDTNKAHSQSWQWEEKPKPKAASDTAFSNSLWLLRDLAPVPEQIAFTSEGLEVSYWRGSLGQALGNLRETVLVPYRDLRPLVRPGTPLARMLAARGMW